MPVSTSLNLQALLKAAAARSGMDLPADRVRGLSAPAQALYSAAQAARLTNGVSLLVVPTDEDVERFTANLRFFFAALEGASAAAVDQAVLPFPSLQADPYRGLVPHFRIASARAAALHALTTGSARAVVASGPALMTRMSAPGRLIAASVELKPGADIGPTALADLLADAGFTREDPVDQHGEFCVRGGIVDLFPAGATRPIRVEFVGDTIESIRRYDPATQRSIGLLDEAAVVPLRELFDDASTAQTPGRPAPPDATFFDYLPPGREVQFLISEESEVRSQVDEFMAQVEASYSEARLLAEITPPPSAFLVDWNAVERRLVTAIRLDQLGIDTPDSEPPAAPEGGKPRTVDIACQPSVEFRGRIEEWAADLRRLRERGDTVLFVAATDGRAERTVELVAEYDLRAVQIDRADELYGATLLVATGQLSRGFRLPGAALQVVAESDVFEEERRVPERRRSFARAFLSDLRDLKVDDLVVHVDHGIGVFVGLKQISIGPGTDRTQEFMELRYGGADKLFVPVECLDLVQKYSGATRPALDRLGGTSWERAKTKVRKAMQDMAEELLKLYAARRAVPGYAFSPDSHFQREFDEAFEYELTPDQQQAITDIKRDMEASTPMDRLLCGDVGYGKTEVAMRAAFKAVMDGKQAAFLAPTTVLAFQHSKTLTERFAAFPVRIGMISRFRTKPEQAAILQDLAAGRIDVIVGTHRLLSKDVRFHDLGLLVVDEEQRFGVAHKERIKQLRKKVDVLTMSATPIPRTLNMSLVGIRDMSIIETPPKDRLSIQTNVVKFDQQVIARAIRHELARGGQVYFVHNRVESIFSIGNLLTRLVPEAKIVVAHGQMDEDQLERAMLDFIARKHDVLLATTIIENGLDISNVNTIIVNRADRYGLSQLYQLRGRVGRSDRPAYSYLLIPPEDSLSAVARKRLAAIKEFSDLGSGFRVAALDLEIRGAGNLLGGEQSGHIEAVGFEMYMKLLEQAVHELKGEELVDEARASVNLRVDLRIDETYVPDMNQRLIIYRKVAAARTDEELDQVVSDLRDRYGPLPVSVSQLEEYGRIRIMADRLGLDAVDREGQVVVFRFGSDATINAKRARIDAEHLVRVVAGRGDVSLAPPATLKLDLRTPLAPARAASGRGGPGTPPRRPRSAASATRSWWTVRAAAGEVTPGFTREEILRAPKEDPSGPNGVFTRVRGLLGELAGAAVE
jgi:transcription-repair coupling factor (superfamily II helicase)